MPRGTERIAWIGQALRNAGLEALVCSLPANILLLSGYWPVVGTALAVATADGQVAVLAPEDERVLAELGWAKTVRTYQPGALTHLTGGPAEAVREPLASLFRDLGVARGPVGYEDGDAYEPASYAAMYIYGAAMTAVLHVAMPNVALRPAGPALIPLRSRLTVDEVGQVRLACAIAGHAFVAGAQHLQPGRHEFAVASAFAAPLSAAGLVREDVERAGGYTYCMSGPNSALAGGAYARTRARELQGGDFVLVHCNSYVDGYWTDITRTYCLGEPDERQRAMYDAVFAARAAALATICPGVSAAAVDKAARDVLNARGFGKDFTHGIGHNVGFSAISMQFPPRLHPASPDHLAIGMTFNIEPAIYIKGYGGLRHCDVVTVTMEGAAVLTPFQLGLEDLVVTGGP